MRPLRLEVTGLTAFKETQVIDFSGLDLFAVTGPTGAGKTSLVDAITYALFGKVPRVDRDMKQLISLETERLIVVLQFANGADRFRIHRATAHKGLPTVRIERLVDPASEEWSAEANGTTDVNDYVTDLLGMDYEGFVRSVLLPQGQFEKFLIGKPVEKYKVLDGLLRLDVYAEMLKRANARRQEHEQEASRYQFALDQYAGATPEAFAEARTALAALAERSEALKKERLALEEANTLAGRLADANVGEKKARKGLDDAETKIATVRKTLEIGQLEIDELDKQQAELVAEIEANQFDADLLTMLTRAQAAHRENASANSLLARTEEAATAAGPKVEQARKRAGATASALATASAGLDQAEREVEIARRENLAATLRRNLKAGDPCPVCGQTVGALTLEAHHTLDAAEKNLAAARQAKDRAEKDTNEARTDVAVRERGLETLGEQVKDARVEVERRAAELSQVLDGRDLPTARVDADIAEQQTARSELQRLNSEKDRVDGLRAEKEAGLLSAREGVAALNQAIESNRKQLDDAAATATDASSRLSRVAAEASWVEVVDAVGAGQDATGLIISRKQAADAEDRDLQQAIGTLKADVERIQEGIEKSAAIQASIGEARLRATLEQDLASLLRTTAFPSFIREQALKLLAQDGSRQLSEISGGRYEFEVEDQDFLVSDRWNGGETRPVRTLSGGETFLASLALALALAERLPSLGAGGQGNALESLFIDEGFSHLDPETLDIVASALEAIGEGGERMVGVVTHLTTLAERMPARIVVHKSDSGSTVTVE